jgi:hypothetical protein
VKKFSFLFLLCFIACGVNGQNADTTWSLEISFTLDNNFFSDRYFAGGSVACDRKWLHAECRYNEEDFNTVSFWGGYNFPGGKKLTYTITPMMGIMAGSTFGVLPGISIELDYKKWTLTDESAFVIYSVSQSDQNYLYTSGELDYSFTDVFYAGIAVSRSRIYQTSLDVQRGICVGLNIKNFSASIYVYDFFSQDTFGLISLSCTF